MARSQHRIGAVSYLNTKPLVFGLRESNPEVQLSFDLPSRLADRFSQGEYDVALIPSIEFLQDPDYVQVSNACIGCVGPVLSVKLYSRVAPEDIQTLAVDEGSRTSAVMSQIWLADKFGVRPTPSPLPIGNGLSNATTDGVLLIGDRAIGTTSNTYVHEWDLGEQWVRNYGTPFVFAVWTARRSAELADLPFALESARDAGTANLSQIAATECDSVNMSHTDCLAYLRDNLHFRFGEQQAAGLEKFRELAMKHNFLAQLTR